MSEASARTKVDRLLKATGEISQRFLHEQSLIFQERNLPPSQQAHRITRENRLRDERMEYHRRCLVDKISALGLPDDLEQQAIAAKLPELTLAFDQLNPKPTQ